MKRSIKTVLTVLTFSLLLGFSCIAKADGMLIPGHWPPPRPIPEIEPMFNIKYHRVNVEINDQAAKTSVDQVFQSQSSRETEATYLFPLPEEAAINDFKFEMDGKLVSGKVLDKDEARRIYEDIVRHRKDPALLEYLGRGMFRASVFPIPPHGEKQIQLTYQEITRARGEQTYRYIYPLDTEKLSPNPIGTVSIHVRIKTKDPLKNIYSPTHQISVRRHGEREAEVSYEISNARPDRDFELFYSISRDDVGLTLLTHYSANEGGFFLLLASPRVDSDNETYIPKDVVFVLDRTGSMGGEKIEQARNALKFCLRSLNSKDKFNVITFNEEPDTMFDSMKTASHENIEKAVNKIEDIEALGGTNIDEALRSAFKMTDGPDKPAYILFLTDGQPTVGITDAATILKNAADNAPESLRLFVFGVGYDVNAHLLDKLSSQNKGISEYVKPDEDIEVKVSDLFRSISSPILTDIKIDYGSMDAFDKVPTQLPDIFKGNQLIIAGRFKDTGKTTIRLTGTANGKKREFKLTQDIPDSDNNTFISPLWASRRIGVLQDEIRLHGENKELIDEIVRLSKRYGIITEYTSFLVEEKEARIAAEDVDGFFGTKLSRKLSEASKDESGSWAVNQSVNNNNLSNALQAPASTQTYFDKTGKTVELNNVQNVRGIAFFNDGGTWTDSRYNTGINIIKIKPFSDAHLNLINAIPELADIFSQGENVIIVIGDTAIKTDPLGLDTLTTDQMKEIQRNKDKLM